jgi:hypothetical protein
LSLNVSFVVKRVVFGDTAEGLQATLVSPGGRPGERTEEPQPRISVGISKKSALWTTIDKNQRGIPEDVERIILGIG